MKNLLKNKLTTFSIIILTFLQLLIRDSYQDLIEFIGVIIGVVIMVIIFYVLITLILEKKKSSLIKNKLFVWNISLFLNLAVTIIVWFFRT